MSESSDNYLKTIFALSTGEIPFVTTTALSEKLQTRASSVTDMIKKLDERGLVRHTPYRGVSLTQKGEKEAARIVRRHRIWEVFLVEKLGFGWEEVHDLAEQLEHVQSAELIKRLEKFLGHPRFDPHGGPIPDEDGKMPKTPPSQPLSSLKEGNEGRITAVNDDSPELLVYMQKQKLLPGRNFKVIRRMDFDGTLEILSEKKRLILSEKAAREIHVIRVKESNSQNK